MLPPVLHADDWLLAVDKPPGCCRWPVAGLPARIAPRAAAASLPDALVVHRLDMATSGLMVFARGERAQRILSMAFAARAVDKRYVAIVAGKPVHANTDGEGWATIELPLAADWPARPRQKVDAASGRPAHALARCSEARRAWEAARGSSCSRHRPLAPVARALAAIGHPVLGDASTHPGDCRRGAAASAARAVTRARPPGRCRPSSGVRRAVLTTIR